MRSRGCQRQGGSEGLAVHDARAGFLAEFQLHTGSKPTLGTTQAVVEGGPVNVLGTLRKNDGRALKPQRLLAGLKDQLGLVVPPGAIWSSNDCLAVGGDGGDGAVEDVIPIMLLGVVLHLRIAPAEDSKVSGTQPRQQKGEDRQDSSLTLWNWQLLRPLTALGQMQTLQPKAEGNECREVRLLVGACKKSKQWSNSR